MLANMDVVCKYTLFFLSCPVFAHPPPGDPPINLHLPPSPILDPISITDPLAANHRTTYAQLDGPGCIQHIWVVLARPNRRSGRQ